MSEILVSHGRDLSGDTRPSNPGPGLPFFNTETGYLEVWNSNTEQWEPASVARGTTAARPSSADLLPGSHYYNTQLGRMEVYDGAAWLTFAAGDEQSSSSSSTSSTSSSSSSTSST